MNATSLSSRVSGGAGSIQIYARVAGILVLLSLIFGYFGEAYVPSKVIVAGDATQTAGNIMSHSSLFRFGFASYLVEALCDVTLALIFYVLLKPVQKNVALLSAFFGLISTAVYAIAELFYFTALVILRSAGALKAFSPEQLNALALLSIKVFANCGGIFLGFYGTASVLRGFLIFRSGYLPKFLGVLLVIGGTAFIVNNLLLVLAPPYATDVVLLAMAPAGISLIVWLLIKGVDVGKWEERIAAARERDVRA